METESIKTLIEQADSDLKKAKGELYQPAEDVVNYCVCVSARIALHRYLYSLYLFLTGDDKNAEREGLTIEQLVDHCSKEFSELKELDFNHIHCKNLNVLNTDDIFFCNDVDVVNHCSSLAEQVRDILVNNIPDHLQPDKSVF